jgi:GNAT superfamily N-acetyltransferase
MLPGGIEIRELDGGDRRLLAAALELLNATQGRGWFADDYLTSRIGRPDALCLVGLRGGEVVAVACAEIVRDLAYYEPFDATIGQRLGGTKVGSLRTMSVRADLQGRGIGTRLSRRRLAWLRAHGCAWALGVSWVSGLPGTSRPVFEKLGFAPVREIAAFYRDAALRQPFACPGCRQHPCVCPAILYQLRLS